MDVLEGAIKTEKRFSDGELSERGIYNLELLNNVGKTMIRFVLQKEGGGK